VKPGHWLTSWLRYIRKAQWLWW